MVVKSYKPFVHLVIDLWAYSLPAMAYLLGVSALDIHYHLEVYDFPVSVIAILGTVIGLLLAFRTNSAYGRWWEARTLWGAVVNDSRSWVRQLLAFTKTYDDDDNVTDALLSEMAYRQIAWCYALSRSLRGQLPTSDTKQFLPIEEVKKYESSHNVPNALLLTQGLFLRKLYQADRLELYQYVELERTLTRLTNSMGGCERIRNTTFPTSYSRMVNGLIMVFVGFLPFGLVSLPSTALVITSLSIVFAFLLIDRVAIYLQDPFSNRPSDTPMLSLSRTVEINIKEMLGQSELPPPLEPVDGILY